MGLKYCIQIKNKIKHNITAFINESDPNSCATLVFTVLISLCVTFFTAILEYAEPTTKDTFVEHNFPDIYSYHKLPNDISDRQNTFQARVRTIHNYGSQTQYATPQLTKEEKQIVKQWENKTWSVFRFLSAGLSSVKAASEVKIKKRDGKFIFMFAPIPIFVLIYMVKHILIGGSVNVLSNIYNYFLKSKSTKKHKKFAFKQRRGLIFKAQITAMLIFTLVIILIRNEVLTRTHISYDFSDLYGRHPKEIYKLHNIEYWVQGILGILIILIS